MRIPISASSRSASVKVAIIAFLTLVLLIPLGMIKGVIHDRQHNESVSVFDIRNTWGGDQTVTGPVLRLPYKVEHKSSHGAPDAGDSVVHLLADELVIDADVASEIRYRGIHQVPIYSAMIRISGRIELGALDALGISAEQVEWSGAEIFLGVSEPRSIRKLPVVAVNGTEVNFTASGAGIQGLDSQLSALLGRSMAAAQRESALTFEISVAVNGSDSLLFLPLSQNAAVTMSADWASPSFTGRQLPSSREIHEDGFEAAWNSNSLGRQLPAIWTGSHAAQFSVGTDSFGARLIQPIDLYQLTERATKYAVLVIGLTFVTYFLMEVVGKIELHPLQYLLVGLANTLFYMLLLSLSEHVGFDLAYLISALASAVLIWAYSLVVLRQRARAVVMAVVLTGLYTFLFLTLKAETFALLAGSIGLWLVLAAIMYLTRRINWYAAGNVDQKQATPD